jgi:hypothetical protein
MHLLHIFLFDLTLSDENMQEEEKENYVFLLGLESIRSDEPLV